MFWNARAYSPDEISQQAQDFLHYPILVNGQSVIVCEYLVANLLLVPFLETQFPFAAFLLGCAQTGHDIRFKECMGKVINGINQDQDGRIVTVEGMIWNVEGGTFYIAVMLPIRDLPAEDTFSYQKASLLQSDEQQRKFWDLSRANFVHNILPADRVFLLSCVVAKTQEILDRKLQQIEHQFNPE